MADLQGLDGHRNVRHGTVALLVVVKRALGYVHRQVLVIGPHLVKLRVMAGKQAALQHFVWAAALAWHDVGRRENFIASLMKNICVLLPTRSQLLFSV